MKYVMVVFICLVSQFCNANETVVLTAAELKKKIIQINHAQNKVMMRGSSKADADQLFSLYTDDFVYVHNVYGGTYSKEHLYNNTIKYIGSDSYSRKTDRYKILTMIAGHNAVAVERLEVDGKANHLTVFEFNGTKVSKIIEYWK